MHSSHFCAGLSVLLFVAPCVSPANVTLPAVFSEHAVLQKTGNAPVWGNADANEKVTVTLDKATASTVAGADGKWKVVLDLEAEGDGPYVLTVDGKNKLTVLDVLVGQVWFCSGQSNMHFPVQRSSTVAAEVSQPANPSLRYFEAGTVQALTPRDDVPGRWEIASPQKLPSFSAVAYYFGKALQNDLQKPVGLIASSLGGTPIEQWISEQGFDADPELKEDKDKVLSNYHSIQNSIQTSLASYQTWLDKYHRQDHPLPAVLTPYIEPNALTRDWKAVEFPGPWSQSGLPASGAVWLRKKITIPPDLDKKALQLKLGECHCDLTIYWNTTKIGQTDAIHPDTSQDTWSTGLVQAGEATLTMRMHSSKDDLGILPGKSAFSLGDKIPLAGEWLAKVEYELPPMDTEARASLPAPPRALPGGLMPPSLLFNGMIHPLIPYAVAGIVWYQGESNVKRAYEYRKAFSLLIQDWRKRWGRGNIPFYYCQLANYTDEALAPGARNPPIDSTWAELRESQSAVLSLPNTEQAVLIDLGEAKNIHPVDKVDVGKRIALIALNKVYSKPVICSGPIYGDMKVEEGKVRVAFKHTDGGLVAKPLPASYRPTSFSPDTVLLVRNSPHSQIEGFAICGEDRKWQWADASISGNDVIVENPGIPHPIAVRYAWADSPICNLYNGAGLPASPFRTDNFPSSTEQNRY